MNTPVDRKALMKAIAIMFGEEREITEGSIAELKAQIDAMDPNLLLKSLPAVVQEQNIAALQAIIDGIMLRKSKTIAPPLFSPEGVPDREEIMRRAKHAKA